MKKTMSRLVCMLLVAAMVCGMVPAVFADAVEPGTLTWTPGEIGSSYPVGTTADINATCSCGGQVLISADGTVITATLGAVTAAAAGEGWLKATCDNCGAADTKNITVTGETEEEEEDAPVELTLARTEWERTVEPGTELTGMLPATVDATGADNASATCDITWDLEGSDYDKDTVGVYTVEGTAALKEADEAKYTLKDSEVTAEITVKPEGYTLSFAKSELTVAVDSTVTNKATLKKNGTTVTSGATIAYIVPDDNGKVKVVGAGEFQGLAVTSRPITVAAEARINGVVVASDTCQVTVTGDYLVELSGTTSAAVGTDVTVTATVYKMVNGAKQAYKTPVIVTFTEDAATNVAKLPTDNTISTNASTGKAQIKLTTLSTDTSSYKNVVVTASVEIDGSTYTDDMTIRLNPDVAEDIYYSSDDGIVYFSASDVYYAVLSATNETVDYVKFDTPTGGTLYTDYRMSTRVTTSTKCYVDPSSSSSCDLDEVVFAPSSSSYTTPSVEYTAYSSNGIVATGTIEIDGDSTYGIEYSTTAGKKVTFDEYDFQEYFEDEYSNGDLEYVVFDVDSDKNLNTKTYGYLYEDTTSSSDKVDDSTDYYYNASTREADLDTITFIPGTRTSSYTIKVPFRAYGEKSNGSSAYVTGTVYIEVNGSSDGIEYSTSAGKKVTFDEDDFQDYFEDEYTNGDLEYVVFNVDSDKNLNTKTYGYLYEDTSSSSDEVDDNTDYYYNATTRQADLDSITFVAGTRTSAYTIKVPFKAYGEKSNGTTGYVTGTVVIEVNGSNSSTGITIYSIGTSFYAADLDTDLIPNEATSSTLDEFYVQFTDVENGTLYYDYDTIVGAEVVTDRDEFYFEPARSELDIADVYFVPAAGATVCTVEYEVYRDGTTRTVDSGEITFRVAAQNKSSFFSDVNAEWMVPAVDFMSYNELVSGTGTKTFSPNVTMTRGMLVTILYRAAGEPSVGTTNPFTDVKTSDYFYKAVLWAYNKGIVTGTTKTTFSPNGAVTREQIAAFLYRYADASKTTGSLSSYTDAGKVSSYAKDAMTWAVKNGIITGKTAKTLDPLGKGTRAEVAVMLHRYLTK